MKKIMGRSILFPFTIFVILLSSIQQPCGASPAAAVGTGAIQHIGVPLNAAHGGTKAAMFGGSGGGGSASLGQKSNLKFGNTMGVRMPSLRGQHNQRMEPEAKAAKNDWNMFVSVFDDSSPNPSSSSAAEFHIPQEYMEGLEESRMHLRKQNINLHYVSGGNMASDELMVFVHGFPEFWYAWRHQLQEFRHDHLVYAIDLRGFGLSDRPRDAINYTVEQHVNDLAEAIELLKKVHPNKKVTLVTHDIGAAIGSALQYSHQQLVDRIVMMNGPNLKSLGNVKLDVKQLLLEEYIQRAMLFFVPFIGEMSVKNHDFKFLEELFLTGKYHVHNKEAFTEADLEVYKNAYKQAGSYTQLTSLTSALNFYRAIPLDVFNKAFKKVAQGLDEKRKELLHNLMFWNQQQNQQPKKQEKPIVPPEPANDAKIKAKTLVIWGMADTVFNKQFADAAVQACEQGRAVKLEGISHWVPEDGHIAVNENIREFMAEPLD